MQQARAGRRQRHRDGDAHAHELVAHLRDGGGGDLCMCGTGLSCTAVLRRVLALTSPKVSGK